MAAAAPSLIRALDISVLREALDAHARFQAGKPGGPSEEELNSLQKFLGR